MHNVSTSHVHEMYLKRKFTTFVYSGVRKMAASSSKEILNLKTFCIVTGASRGIGRAIATSLSKKFSVGSVIVITGRTETALNETKRLIEEVTANVGVRIVVADLGNQATFPDCLSAISKDVDPSDYQHGLLIHNAGEMWDISRCSRQFTISDLEDLQRYWMLTLTSTFLLSAKFLQVFSRRDSLRRSIVTISSKATRMPFPCT